LIRVAVVLLSVTGAAGCNSDRSPDREAVAIAEILEAEGVAGTLVIANSDGEIVHVYNEERAQQRFSPASTFKIPNTLIALDAAVIPSQGAIFTWDGVDRGMAQWNRDQTLASAFQVSCVWCYQEIAREVGRDLYAGALAAIDYGNRQLGDEVDRFWLDGTLQISAIEQVAFLRKLYDYALPYSRDHIEAVKDIMVVETTANYTMRAKTGWSGADLQVGWYVGYLERDDEVWLFAMNMKMERADQAPLRGQLTRQSLKALGFLR
jgi:beta-lactamase class D